MGLVSYGVDLTNANLNPALVPGLSNIVEIGLGWDVALALDSTGRVWGWGWGLWGQLGIDDADATARPLRNPNVEFVQKIWAGYHCEFARGALENDRPSQLVARPMNQKISLTWHIYPGAVAYNIYRSLLPGGPYTQAGSVVNNSFTNTGLTNGTNYYYVVTALAASSETPYSDEVTAAPIPPPDTPHWDTNFGNGGVQPLCRDIKLQWNPASGASDYRVSRAPSNSGPWTLIALTSATNVVDDLVQHGSAYYYYVTALNSAGDSLASTTNGPFTNGVDCAPAPLLLGVSVPDYGQLEFFGNIQAASASSM